MSSQCCGLAGIELDHALITADFKGCAETAGVEPSGLDMGDGTRIELKGGEGVVAGLAREGLGIGQADGAGRDRLNFAKRPAEPIEVVDGKVKEHATRPRSILEPAGAADWGFASASRASGNRVAHGTLGDQFMGMLEVGKVSDHLGGHQGDPGFVGGIHHLVTLGDINSHGLFAENMATGGDRLEGRGVVGIRGQANIYSVGPVEQFFIACRWFQPVGLGESIAAFGVELKELELDVWHVLPVPSVDIAHPAGADNPNS